MYKTLIAITVLASAVSLTTAQTNTHTNTNLTTIYGSGNSDTNWTAGRANDIEVGLRAKNRYVGPIVPGGPGDNVYIVQAGISSGSAAIWNFDFSVLSDTTASDSVKLLTYDYKLSLDIDPTAGVSFIDINFIEFNPVTQYYTDNQWGFGGTANGDGVVLDIPTALFSPPGGTDFTKVQNSRNFGWDVPGFNPHQNGTYDIMLEAFNNDNTELLAGSRIQVVVVPEPATILASIFGLGMVGVVGYRRRFGKKAA